MARKRDADRGVEVGRRIDFLGYQFSRERVLLRKSIKKKFARKVKTKNPERRRQMLASYWGWCKWGNCRHLWNTITNNDMSFADKGIKGESGYRNGKRFFNVPSKAIMEIVNVPITVLDFEPGIDIDAERKDRYSVLCRDADGKEFKFLTSSGNIKYVLDQAREKEKDETKIFPVENVVVKRKSYGDSKYMYIFDE